MSFPRQRFVLDTTAFSDHKLISRLGGNIALATNNLTELLSIGRLRLNISCYMPPSTFNELKNFLLESKCTIRDIDQVEAWVVRKSPDRHSVLLTSQIIYEYVSDVRDRLDQGMSIVSRAINEAIKRTERNLSEDKKNHNSKELEKELINNFQDKYRQKMRKGVLDSLPDIDTLILAKELGAGVVSADTGIRAWTERMGIRFVEAEFFPQIILTYLERLEDLSTTINDIKKWGLNRTEFNKTRKTQNEQ